MGLFGVFNGPRQTTAQPAGVTTGAATLKTLLQLQPRATKIIRIHEWGISFDGQASAAPGIIELIEVDVAATVTAFVANDINKLDGDALLYGDVTTNLIQVGTANSGYTATAEGSITALRNLDMPFFAQGTLQPYLKQYPLGEGPVVQAGKFCRIRTKFAAAVAALCWIKFEL